MPISYNTPNILNSLEIRRVDVLPPHFTTITLDLRFTSRIEEWILQRLTSRYYIEASLKLIDNNITYLTTIGFESPKDATMFTLACPIKTLTRV